MYPTLLIAVSLMAAPTPSATSGQVVLEASSPSAASALLVESAELIPTVALSAAPSAAPSAKRGAGVKPKVVTYKSEDGLELTANYFAPEDDSARTPVAILVHDAGGNRDQMTLFAERLHSQGMAVLAPDIRGHGASASPTLDWSELEAGEREKLWSFAPRDLVAATEWIDGRRELHGANITLIGLRAGCALSVYHAGRDSDVRAVVLIEPNSEPELGFNLIKEVERLAGLTTKVFTPREKENAAMVIKAGGTEANDGLEFIEIDLCKSKGEDLIHDRRVATDVAKWVKNIAFPKRGRR